MDNVTSSTAYLSDLYQTSTSAVENRAMDVESSMDEIRDHISNHVESRFNSISEAESISRIQIDLENACRIATEALLTCERLTESILTTEASVESLSRHIQSQFRCLKYEMKCLKGCRSTLIETELTELRSALSAISSYYDIVDDLRKDHDDLKYRFEAHVEDGTIPPVLTEMNCRLFSQDISTSRDNSTIEIIDHRLSLCEKEQQSLLHRFDIFESNSMDSSDSFHQTISSLVEDVASLISQQIDSAVLRPEELNEIHKEILELTERHERGVNDSSICICALKSEIICQQRLLTDLSERFVKIEDTLNEMHGSMNESGLVVCCLKTEVEKDDPMQSELQSDFHEPFDHGETHNPWNDTLLQDLRWMKCEMKKLKSQTALLMESQTSSLSDVRLELDFLKAQFSEICHLNEEIHSSFTTLESSISPTDCSEVTSTSPSLDSDLTILHHDIDSIHSKVSSIPDSSHASIASLTSDVHCLKCELSKFVHDLQINSSTVDTIHRELSAVHHLLDSVCASSARVNSGASVADPNCDIRHDIRCLKYAIKKLRNSRVPPNLAAQTCEESSMFMSGLAMFHCEEDEHRQTMTHSDADVQCTAIEAIRGGIDGCLDADIRELKAKTTNDVETPESDLFERDLRCLKHEVQFGKIAAQQSEEALRELMCEVKKLKEVAGIAAQSEEKIDIVRNEVKREFERLLSEQVECGGPFLERFVSAVIERARNEWKEGGEITPSQVFTDLPASAAVEAFFRGGQQPT
jgi:hypothetical protein